MVSINIMVILDIVHECSMITTEKGKIVWVELLLLLLHVYMLPGLPEAQYTLQQI
mgnify:CR=1 FL=1